MHGITNDFLGDGDLAHNVVKTKHVFAGEVSLDGRGQFGGRARDHGDLFILRQVIHHDIEHEPIELSLGQRISALHFDWILRGEHEERLFQRIADARDSDLMLLHRFEQRGLSLGRRAVNFVG